MLHSLPYRGWIVGVFGRSQPPHLISEGFDLSRQRVYLSFPFCSQMLVILLLSVNWCIFVCVLLSVTCCFFVVLGLRGRMAHNLSLCVLSLTHTHTHTHTCAHMYDVSASCRFSNPSLKSKELNSLSLYMRKGDCPRRMRSPARIFACLLCRCPGAPARARTPCCRTVIPASST